MRGVRGGVIGGAGERVMMDGMRRRRRIGRVRLLGDYDDDMVMLLMMLRFLFFMVYDGNGLR